MEKSNEHIVMVPFMAHGHLIPFLSLANAIHNKTSFTITILSTPLNVHYLKSMSHDSPINFAELPFSSADHGLPPESENTEDLPLHQIITLFHSSLSLQTPLHNFISELTLKEGRPPLCIISDAFFGWVNEVANSTGTVNVGFATGGAYGTAAMVSLWQHLPHRLTDRDEFPLPGFPNSHLFNRSQLHKFLRSADGTDDWCRFFRPQYLLSLKSCGWLINTVEEIEPLGLQILRDFFNVRVWTIGRKLSNSGRNFSKCIEWLDLHPKGSVLYVSFGSQNSIKASQMMELAKGLEESEVPFIWVVRPPLGFSSKGEFRVEWLPEGFEERVGKRGLIVQKWAPQMEILSHGSTGAFLTHCGWNSVMESLSRGVPMIGWPLAADQTYNSKMMVEEMGVCVEVSSGMESEVNKEDVKRVIKMVMGREDMKRKAGEIKEMIRAAMEEDGGSSVLALDDFISTLLSHRKAS